MLFALPAAAQSTVDRPIAVTESTKFAPEAKLRWRETYFLFQQSVSTQTLGVGSDYQSRNPYYAWSFFLRPRLYVWESERSSLSVRGQLMVMHEFTNSDSTAKRGELTLQDSVVSLVPEHVFYADGDYETRLTLSLPRLEFPTSDASRAAGKIMQVGARALFTQAVALRAGEDLVPRGHAGLRLGYGYEFTSSTVPETSDLNRVRVDLEGHSVTNHQLAGGALAEHRGVVHGLAGADIYRDLVSLEVEAGIDPYSRYELAERVEVCNVATGCAQASGISDPQRYGVTTFFDAHVDVNAVRDILRASVGWENIAPQIGADGQRRTLFWSPESKFYLTLELRLDGIYQGVRSKVERRSASAAR